MSKYGYTGKGKKGRSSHKPLRSVYAAESYNVLKKTAPFAKGYRGPRVRNSNVMNPVTYGVVFS